MTTPTTTNAATLIGQALEKLNEAAMAGCPGMVTAAEPLIKARDLLREQPTGLTPVEAINGLCWAASTLSFSAFCRTLGWNEDDYAEAKYDSFQEAARLLGRFDNNVVTTLVSEGLRRGGK